MIRLIPVLLILLSTSCGVDKAQQVAHGEKLFHSVHIGKNNVIGCISCHTLKPDITTAGPSLYAFNLRADKLVAELSAEQYIKQSIINPDAYIVNGYSPAVMFAHYQDELSNDEITALVAFLTHQD
jgi:mono/diheme cytochrome c family protein